MATWNVPIFDWLPVLDDGHGRWKESLYFDHAHPNTEAGGRYVEELFSGAAAYVRVHRPVALLFSGRDPSTRPPQERGVEAVCPTTVLQSVKISFPAVCDPRSSLSQLDAAERQPSYSNLDEVVQASQAEEETARGAPVGLPAFEEPRHRVIWTSSSLDIYKVRIF